MTSDGSASTKERSNAHLTEGQHRSEARSFWSQTDTGRDFCVAITYTADDALVVWDALRRARAFVIEREHDENRYKGRFVRGWSEDDGFFWTESPDEEIDRARATSAPGTGAPS